MESQGEMDLELLERRSRRLLRTMRKAKARLRVKTRVEPSTDSTDGVQAHTPTKALPRSQILSTPYNQGQGQGRDESDAHDHAHAHAHTHTHTHHTHTRRSTREPPSQRPSSAPPVRRSSSREDTVQASAHAHAHAHAPQEGRKDRLGSHDSAPPKADPTHAQPPAHPHLHLPHNASPRDNTKVRNLVVWAQDKMSHDRCVGGGGIRGRAGPYVFTSSTHHRCVICSGELFEESRDTQHLLCDGLYALGMHHRIADKLDMTFGDLIEWVCSVGAEKREHGDAAQLMLLTTISSAVSHLNDIALDINVTPRPLLESEAATQLKERHLDEVNLLKKELGLLQLQIALSKDHKCVQCSVKRREVDELQIK